MLVEGNKLFYFNVQRRVLRVTIEEAEPSGDNVLDVCDGQSLASSRTHSKVYQGLSGLLVEVFAVPQSTYPIAAFATIFALFCCCQNRLNRQRFQL